MSREAHVRFWESEGAALKYAWIEQHRLVWPVCVVSISDPLRRPLDVPSEPVQKKQLEIYKKQTAH